MTPTLEALLDAAAANGEVRDDVTTPSQTKRANEMRTQARAHASTRGSLGFVRCVRFAAFLCPR